MKRENCKESSDSRKRGSNKYDKSRKSSNDRSRRRPRQQDEYGELDSKGRDNDPNWYFLDAGVAEQVSRLSMRNFVGQSVEIMGASKVNLTVTPIYTVYLMPSAGTMNTVDAFRNSGINQAGFRIYTRLAAFTGRALSYGPQDISIMTLAMGEMISMVEFLRRAFGVAYTYSQRNRTYPRAVIQAMGIDADDLFENFSAYRNEFNRIITRINQIPIPKGIAYFDKCASLYEKLYLDSDSPMAQTVVTRPLTTWVLDEQSFQGGSILKTRALTSGNNRDHMSVWFTHLKDMVDAILSSSTLNIVFADMLNFFSKVGGEVWLFDYLTDGYSVVPEFNIKFMMQLHNATIMSTPNYTSFRSDSPVGSVKYVTPQNDVYSLASENAVVYAPAFNASNLTAHTPLRLLIDFETGNPTSVDIIENTRFTALQGSTIYDDGTNKWILDSVLPDHFIVGFAATDNDGVARLWINTTKNASVTIDDIKAADALSKLDWAPLVYFGSLSNGAVTYSDTVVGDLNYYTTIDYWYLRPIDEFISLALYDLRK